MQEDPRDPRVHLAGTGTEDLLEQLDPRDLQDHKEAREIKVRFPSSTHNLRLSYLGFLRILDNSTGRKVFLYTHML